MNHKLKWFILVSLGFLLIAFGSISIIFGALETSELFIKIGLIAIIAAVLIYTIIFILALYNYLKRK